MAKYRVDLDVVDAGGQQTIEVEAESLEEAFKKLQNGDGDIVEHEVEVTSLSEYCLLDVYASED